MRVQEKLYIFNRPFISVAVCFRKTRLCGLEIITWLQSEVRNYVYDL